MYQDEYEPQRSRGRPEQQQQQQQQQPRRRLKVERPQQQQQREQPIDRSDKIVPIPPVDPNPSYYKPASGPAYATATNVGEIDRQFDIGAGPVFDAIPYPTHAEGVPADQRSLEAAVIDGANAYKPDVSDEIK